MRYLLSMLTIALSITSGPAAFAFDWDQIAYFKSSTRDRVFVYQTAKLDPQSAKAHALKQAYTPGQMTAVYIYGPGKRTPGNVLSTYKSIFQVNDALYESTAIDSWDYVLMYNRDGSSEWVDCNSSTPNDFCR